MSKPDLRNPGAVAQAVEEAAGHYRQGRLDEADRICTRILKSRPDWFDALHLAGLVKLESGKATAAHALLTAALKLNAGSAAVLSNLARALAALDRNDEALAAVDKSLALAPDNFEALNNRGNILLKLNRADDAMAAFERVLAIEPRFVGARANLGNVLAQVGRFDEALAHYDAVLATYPMHAEVLLNRGSTLAALGRNAEAIDAFDRALAIRPGYARARLGRGATLQALNRNEEALAEFGSILAADKTNADARHNQALSLLTLGDYRRGFESYEARWSRTGMPRRRSLGKPLWLGEYPLGRKTILIHGEQGLGDTIQFIRYAPLLARGGATVVLEVQSELLSLLSRVDGVAASVARGETLPPFDVHCPVGSLPHAFRTEVATIPATIPYLAANADRIERWRERIERLPSPRIAFAWSGRATHANDRNRSIALAHFAPLLSKCRASFLSIQRDLREGDADTLARLPNVSHLGDSFADFDDTAAVVTLVDLVISVDTSVAHLTGAMGRPLWLLIPFQPDWRWMLQREDSPWYPTVRLFRQPSPGDWEPPLAHVADALSQLRGA